MQIKLIFSFLLVAHYSNSVEFTFFLEGKEFLNVTVSRKTYWNFWGPEKENMFCRETLGNGRLCTLGALAIGELLSNPDKMKTGNMTFSQRARVVRSLARLQSRIEEAGACEDIKVYARHSDKRVVVERSRYAWDLTRIEFFMKRSYSSLQPIIE